MRHKHELYTTRSSIGCCLQVLPADEILLILIPADLLKKLRNLETNELMKLECEIQDAIEDGQFISYYQNVNPDWKACRTRVNAVLAQYGYELPKDDKD